MGSDEVGLLRHVEKRLFDMLLESSVKRFDAASANDAGWVIAISRAARAGNR